MTQEQILFYIVIGFLIFFLFFQSGIFIKMILAQVDKKYRFIFWIVVIAVVVYLFVLAFPSNPYAVSIKGMVQELTPR
ncbi:MAG: hypothetical protein AMQ74_01324 [Candidatus Methanofastidiosum methylothiophilum]|uniref:Uncharacterized protein n=1 Tax=Candidatus Methanofastidiosum methylothiophilum TaxID=1705564 RepID=A0A150IYU8_9EURY|nr:MAG: hypothetical protein AMQ74_01324 [Candidatus Methanofastidiosum methylthiophilus]